MGEAAPSSAAAVAFLLEGMLQPPAIVKTPLGDSMDGKLRWRLGCMPLPRGDAERPGEVACEACASCRLPVETMRDIFRLVDDDEVGLVGTIEHDAGDDLVSHIIAPPR